MAVETEKYEGKKKKKRRKKKKKKKRIPGKKKGYRFGLPVLGEAGISVGLRRLLATRPLPVEN